MTLTRVMVLVVLALVAASRALVAQDSQPAPKRITEWSADLEAYDLGDRIWTMAGNVRLTIGDLRIRATNAVLYIVPPGARTDHPASRPGDLPPVVPPAAGRLAREIYLDGVVMIWQGAEATRASAAYFDFEHDRGIILDGVFEAPIASVAGDTKLVLRAEELRLLSQSRMEAIGVSATTCPFGHPHVHVDSDRMEIIRHRVVAKPSESRPGHRSPDQALTYSADGNLLVVGGLPAIWLPSFSGDTATPLGAAFRYIRDVRFGSSDRFGRRVGVTLGDDIVKDDGTIWGDYGVRLDYLSKRGPGVGIDLAYDQPTYKGHVNTYYQRDTGTDSVFGVPSTENRGRLFLQHRQLLPWEVQLDVEAAVFSDRSYYETYLQEEFRGDKPPETYIYAKRAFHNSQLSALFSDRLDHFETDTLYRPKVDYTLVTEPVFDIASNPLYLSSHAEATSLRRTTDKDLNIPDRANTRIDLDNVLEYPFAAGPLKVTPFAGLRTTWYESDLAGNDDRFRNAFTYGGEVSTQAWRTFDVSGGLFGLDGLRHVIRPSVEYRRTTGVDLTPPELFQFDQVDTVANRDTVLFEVRNLFQTVRHRATGDTVDELFDADLHMTFFPQPTRDNNGEPWGHLFADTVVRFSDRLQLLTDFEHDTSNGNLIDFNIAAGYTPTPDFQTYAGFRHFDNTYDVVFNQTNWRASEKWLVRLYNAYDFVLNRTVQHDLTLTRLGHDWAVDFSFRYDYAQNDLSFNIAFRPRFLFNPLAESEATNLQPRFHFLNGIHK